MIHFCEWHPGADWRKGAGAGRGRLSHCDNTFRETGDLCQCATVSSAAPTLHGENCPLVHDRFWLGHRDHQAFSVCWKTSNEDEQI